MVSQRWPGGRGPPQPRSGRQGLRRERDRECRSAGPGWRDTLLDQTMSRATALKMIKRRARQAGLPAEICAVTSCTVFALFSRILAFSAALSAEGPEDWERARRPMAEIRKAGPRLLAQDFAPSCKHLPHGQVSRLQPARARSTASGSLEMTVSRARAATSGCRRPCSQFRIESMVKPYTAAKRA